MAQQLPAQPPPPPPGGYAPPGGPTNGLAIAGMVVGISSLVLFWLAWIATIIAIVGLVLSLVGLSKANRMGGLGKGMAVAGVVTSSVAIAASIILTIVVAQKIQSGEIIIGTALPLPAIVRRRGG